MISALRDYFERWRLRASVGRSSAGAAQGQVAADPRATYRRAPGEEWSFDGQHVFCNGSDIADLLELDQGDIGTWCGIIDVLTEYRGWALQHHAHLLEKLSHVVGGLQERALLLLRRVYEEKVGGLHLAWGDGQFLLNNVNVRAMMAMYHVRPTRKAKRFLEGLRNKLALILCSQTASPHMARAQEVVRDVYADLCSSLATPTVDTLCLPVGHRHHTG